MGPRRTTPPIGACAARAAAFIRSAGFAITLGNTRSAELSSVANFTSGTLSTDTATSIETTFLLVAIRSATVDGTQCHLTRFTRSVSTYGHGLIIPLGIVELAIDFTTSTKVLTRGEYLRIQGIPTTKVGHGVKERRCGVVRAIHQTLIRVQRHFKIARVLLQQTSAFVKPRIATPITGLFAIFPFHIKTVSKRMQKPQNVTYLMGQ